MKLVTKKIIIENKDFALISDIHPINNKIYYGTISYDDIDENMRIKRSLNGFDMCVADSIDEAINFRKIQLNLNIDEILKLRR